MNISNNIASATAKKTEFSATHILHANVTHYFLNNSSKWVEKYAIHQLTLFDIVSATAKKNGI